ncbi:GyrI-like domain-containing protein [Paenibacillus mesophilus]|uniref:GyrI-like domain-containing protein n=1 Tax=Paenibacillus mesophilus TaxID=2582849 RepID=UPI0013050CBF|nr:GyrI-like domain-containing protein [Paenibacillus mesophilus]
MPMLVNDNRKSYPDVYKLKAGAAEIVTMPALQFISQEMYGKLGVSGRPEEGEWIVWKIVNQLKRLTKNIHQYKFKLMPHEIVWHRQHDDEHWSYSIMMQVPDLITFELYEQARASVCARYKEQEVPETRFVGMEQGLCAQKLHVGPYRETWRTLREIEAHVEERGYRITGDRREVYLNQPGCNPTEKWQTIVRVPIG